MKLEMSLALICALSVVFVAHGCSFTHDVVASGISASATPNGIPLDGYNASAARNLIVNQATQHLNNQEVVRGGDIRSQYFSCVDARGPDPMLGTPGGDFSEFSIALQTHEKLTGQRLTRTEVETIFNQFMESRHITPSRPFYFHNADNNLRVMFSKLASKISPPPVILPDTMPANLEVWLEALVDPDANGCVHVRLQLAGQKNDTVTYTPNANGTATCTVAKGSGTEFAYGPRAQFMSQELVRAFYKYYWSAAPGSIKRQKILNELLPGPLIGRSVTIVTANDPQAPPSGHRRLLQLGALVGALTSTLGLPGSGVAPLLSGVANTAASLLNAGSYSKSYDAANTCSLAYPLVQPTKGASTVFIYHPQAVGQFRKRVLGRWFVETQARGRYNEDTFAAECDRKGVADLGATLAYLSPANCITITTGQYNRA